MPWKDRYTISNERSIADRDVRWPNGLACSFTITVSLDPPCGPEGLTPADLKTPEAYYGMHGGLDALRAVLDKNGVRATVAVSAAVADIHPTILRSLAADGHEIAAHGYLREDVSTLDIADERERLKRTTDASVRRSDADRSAGIPWHGRATNTRAARSVRTRCRC